MRPLLAAALTMALMTAPAHALSTVSLPIRVPLSGVQTAANARLPLEFARVDETRAFLGGLLSVNLRGTVTRTGHVSVRPSADGRQVVLSVPIRADFRATPGGAGAVLARDFGGAATVQFTLGVGVTPGWDLQTSVVSDYAWTDPLAVDLGQGVRVSVQALADAQVRQKLSEIAVQVEAAVRDGAALPRRVDALWGKLTQPWALPTPEPAYALVRPTELSFVPIRVTPQAIALSVGATFELSAALGRPPVVASSPPLNVSVAEAHRPGVELRVPVRLPYPELSQAATKYASARTFPLPVPTRPTLRVLGVTLKPAGQRLSAAVRLEVAGPLGLKVQATTDVTGTPQLDAAGRVLTLKDVTVSTRREGLSGRVIAWLADARAQAYVRQAARFDLGPQLDKARAGVQARLPFSPVPGVTLSGTVGPLRLSALTVTPGALVATAEAGGQLAASVDAARLTLSPAQPTPAHRTSAR